MRTGSNLTTFALTALVFVLPNAGEKPYSLMVCGVLVLLLAVGAWMMYKNFDQS